MSITQSQVDLIQGQLLLGGKPRAFGFVASVMQCGGMFFTWLPTVEETIDTLEGDIVDGDGGLDWDEVAEFLREYLPTTSRGRSMWKK